MKKRVALLVLVLIASSIISVALPPPPPGAPPKPNLNFPEQQPAAPVQQPAQSIVPQVASPQGSGALLPPTQTQTRVPVPDEASSFWVIALIAGASIILIVIIVAVVISFMKSKTVPDSLKSYIKYNMHMGYRMDALEPLLLNAGWSKEQITKAYREVTFGKVASGMLK